MFIYNCIAIPVKLFNFFLFIVFGQRYIHLIDVCSRYYITLGSMLTTVEGLRRRLDETLTRLTYVEEKNDTLKGELDNLKQEQNNLNERITELESRQVVESGTRPPLLQPPPPPPPPPSQPVSIHNHIGSCNAHRAANRQAKHVLPPPVNRMSSTSKSASMPCLAKADLPYKRTKQNPSSAELKAKKTKLKSTDIKRTPGGTPMLTSKRNLEPNYKPVEINELMKIAIEKRLAAFRPMSPMSTPSKYGSLDNSEDFSNSDSF